MAGTECGVPLRWGYDGAAPYHFHSTVPLFGTLLGRYFRVEQEPEPVPQALAQMAWGMWHDRSSGVG